MWPHVQLYATRLRGYRADADHERPPLCCPRASCANARRAASLRFPGAATAQWPALQDHRTVELLQEARVRGQIERPRVLTPIWPWPRRMRGSGAEKTLETPYYKSSKGPGNGRAWYLAPYNLVA